MIAGIPLIMTLLFGYAINQDLRHLRAAVADLAGTQRSRLMALDAQATQVLDIVQSVSSAKALEDLLVRGEISVGILIPHDFERRVAHRDRPAAQLLVDGGDPIVLLIMTPIHTVELMVGKVVPYVVIGYVQVSLILLLGWLLFDVPIRGSLADLYLDTGAFVSRSSP